MSTLSLLTEGDEAAAMRRLKSRGDLVREEGEGVGEGEGAGEGEGEGEGEG